MGDGHAPAAIVWVKVASIDPWPRNPRDVTHLDVSDIVSTLRIIDGAPADELSGIREPLWLRPHGAGRYHSIKGARRTMAAALAGQLEVPARIVDMDDTRALEEALVDDARKALGPLEEARALAQLRGERSWTPKELADRTGKTERTVRKRLVLVDELLPETQAALGDGKTGKITLGLAEDLATLSREAPPGAGAKSPQAAALEAILGEWRAGDGPVGRSDARWEIQRQRLQLLHGGFALDDAALVPGAGACTTCPKRSGAQLVAFADGIERDDLCGDAKCFGEKRKASAERVREAAKARGIPVADKAAEVKKLFPWGRDVSRDSGFVDLAAPCDLVRPPRVEKPKAEPRKGGAEKCTDGGSHTWDMERSAVSHPDHPAAKAGVESWAECDGEGCDGEGCDAWEEIEDEDDRAGVPRGWKPPTWGEALAQAAAKLTPASPQPVAPAMIAIDPAGAPRELHDQKAAMKLLKSAGLITPAQERNEVRDHKPLPKKNAGELDKWELDRKAKDDATAEARTQIRAKAAKKTADVRFWRFLAGLVLSDQEAAYDRDGAEAALAARVPKVEAPAGKKAPKSNADDGPWQGLRAWVGEQKEEGPVRALIVELLLKDDAGDDAPLPVACRFYGVDLAELQKTAKDKIKAEQKAEQKAAADKAKKPAPAKGAPAPASGKTVAPKKPAPVEAFELTPVASKILAALVELGGEGSTKDMENMTSHPIGVCGEQLGEMAAHGLVTIKGLRWAITATGRAAVPEDFPRVLTPAKPPKPAPAAEPDPKCSGCGAALVEGFTICERCEAAAAPICHDCEEPLLPPFLACEACGTPAAAPSPPVEKAEAPACPLDWPGVQALAKRCGFEPHDGAHAPGNVWKCVETIRVIPEPSATREAIYALDRNAGTGSFDCAILYLCDAGELTLTKKGKKPGADVFERAPAGPGSDALGDSAPLPTVQLEGEARKGAEARPCPTCKAKPGKGCVALRGKLGTGWFHRARVEASPPATGGMLADRGRAFVGTPGPDLVEAVQAAAVKHRAAIAHHVEDALRIKPRTPEALRDAVDVAVGAETWYGGPLGDRLYSEALTEMYPARIELRSGVYHLAGGAVAATEEEPAVDYLSVPCPVKTCEASAHSPCTTGAHGRGEEREPHEARVKTAKAQLQLPSESPIRRAVISACGTPRTREHVVLACRDHAKADVEAEIDRLHAAEDLTLHRLKYLVPLNPPKKAKP